MSEQSKLTDELTGNSGVQTDHGELDAGDLIVLLFDLVLLIYTGWRSYDFLSTTVPDGWSFLALIGLWGLDIGAVGWSLVWIFGSTTKYQDWTAITFFVIDLLGVVMTSVTDSLMYTDKSKMSDALSGIAMVLIPLVIVGNVIAGFVYHMTSPATKVRRLNRKAAADHKRKMDEVAQMERDLTYAESYLLARQDQLDKSQLLAGIKVQQDALEKALRAQLNDRVGVSTAAATATDKGPQAIADLRARLANLKASLSGAANPVTPPEESEDQSPVSGLIPDKNDQVLVPAINGNGHIPQGPVPNYHNGDILKGGGNGHVPADPQ
jgi:hypothetical protein